MKKTLGNKNQERQAPLRREALLGIPEAVIQRKPQTQLVFHRAELVARTCRDRLLRQHPALLIRMILVFFLDCSLTSDLFQQL